MWFHRAHGNLSVAGRNNTHMGNGGARGCASQQPQSDVFSSSGQYDNFAVGGAHLVRQPFGGNKAEVQSLPVDPRRSQDLSGQGLALFDESRRPGLRNEQRTALVKQANEQIRLRGDKLRAFTNCVNNAIRRLGPLSDEFASSGGPPSDPVQPQPVPEPSPFPD